MTARFIHSWLGLFFSAILIFVATTGALSVFADEIDWLIRPAMRVAATSPDKGPVGQSLVAATAALPGAVPLDIDRFSGPRYADRVTLGQPGKGRSFVWVDPYSGKVTGITSTATFRDMIRELHRSLSTGRTIAMLAVTTLSLPLAAMVIAGLLLYRRFWTGFFRKPRLSGSRRAIFSDLHRLIAVWLLPFLTVTVLTSMVFLSEFIGFSPVKPETPMATTRDNALPEGFTGADLDRAVAAAQAAMPGFSVTEIALPKGKMAPLTLRGIDGTLLTRPSAAAIHLDPATGATLAVQPAGDLSAHMRVFEGARVLHYGTFGGLATRILWVLFGLGLATLGLLGALVSAERLTKEFMVRKRPERSRLGHYLTGAGIGNWPGLAAALLAVLIAVWKAI